MPSIADVFVTLLPETRKIADGIRQAFREADPIASEAGRRWGQEIERGIGKINVEVSADTAKARAEIDAVGRDRKATIEVDADTMGASLEQAVSKGMSSGGSAGLSALNPALMGVGITLAAGVASSLSGLAGLLPAGLLGGGAVIGTLATGLSGVKEAWDSAGKAADSSGTDQAAKAKEVASAQKELRDAVQSEEQAQKDVASARKDALTELRDLNMELHGGALDEKQAQLDALKARQDLATGTFKTALDYQQAQLRVQEADQRAAETHQRNIDLQAKANDERAKGVDGADNVVRANQNLARTQEQVATAQGNLNDALTKTSSAASKAAEDMAKLSPNAQAFVNTLIGLKPAWDSLKNSVQDSLFANLGPQIQQLATQYLPLLQGAMTGMAGTMNQAFGQIAKIFAQPETMAAMQRIFASIGGSFQIWSQSITPFTQAFLKFTEVGASFLPQLAQMAVQAANAFNGFAQSGALQQWMQTAMTALGEVGKMLPTLGKMFMDLAPMGLPVLQALNSALTALAPAIGPLATLMASWVTAISPLLSLLIQIGTTVFNAIAPAFQQWFTAMAPVAQQLVGALQPVLQQLGPVLGQVAGQLGSALVSAAQQLAPVIVPLVKQFAEFAAALLPLLPSLMKLALTALPMIVSALVPLIPQFTELLKKMTDAALVIVPQIVSAFSTFSDKVTTGFNTVKKVWDVTLGPIFETMKTFTGPLTALANLAGSGSDDRQGTVLIPPGGASRVVPGTLSRGTPGVPTRGALSTQRASGSGPASSINPDDAALLAGVPAGRYSQAPDRDLLKGLSDCSSSIGDLVNIMDGQKTGSGGNLTTGNASTWLPAHGFIPNTSGANVPGAFNVGYNDHHMQATLPGGTNFNYGSDAAAANRGIGGSGAFDPAFNQHYYLPAGAGGMPPGMPATAATPGPTGAPNDPYFMQYPDGYKPPGPDMGQLGQQMGGDVWSSILPDGFKNPTQFGGMKFLTGLMGGLLGMPMGGSSTGAGKGQPASYWAGGGADGGGGGGGGLLSGLMGLVSKPFGQLQIGSPGNAPGEFMPGMPTSGDAMASPFGAVGQAGTAGPGNNGQVIDNSINVNNPMGQQHFDNMVTTAQQAQVPRQRQGMRPLP